MPDQVRHDEFGPFCETNNVWQFHKSAAAGQKNGQSDQKRNFELVELLKKQSNDD